MIAALDLSLTSTGMASVHAGEIHLERLQPKRVKGYERLGHIQDRVLDFVRSADVVAVEGPAFGAQGSAYHQLAGLWWVITKALHEADIQFAVIPPSSVKQYATGKGNAPKDLVLAAAVRRFPQAEVDGNDVADALWMAALAHHFYSTPIVTVPAVNLKALEKVEWPALTHEGEPTL